MSKRTKTTKKVESLPEKIQKTKRTSFRGGNDNPRSDVLTPENLKLLEGVLQVGTPLRDCAALLGVPKSTLQDHIRKEFGCSFSEYMDRFECKNKILLRQNMYAMANSKNHPAISIFLSKNKLDMTDKQELVVSGKSTSELIEEVQILSEELKQLEIDDD